ncbi:MAG TPA: hypothetical protein VGM03_24625 [Phycisphaerae bacterium]
MGRFANYYRSLLASAACVAIGARAHAQGLLVDDFNDGNDTGWTHVEGLEPFGFGPTIYSATTGRYVIASSGTLPAYPLTLATGAVWEASASDPAYSNGTLRVNVRVDNASTNLFTVLRGSATNGNGYGFAANHVVNLIQIVRVTNFGFTTLASAPFMMMEGQDYILEGRAVGTDLSLRIWAVDGEEPTEPQLTAVDATYSSGALGLFIANQSFFSGGTGGPLSASFDDVFFESAVNISASNPPNLHRDVLQNTTAALLAQGIGAAGTPNEGPVTFAPFSVTFSGTPVPPPSPVNIIRFCTDLAANGQTDCPTITVVSGSGAGPYQITLSAPPPPRECVTFTFAGTNAGQKLQYQVLPGDTNLDGIVSTQDLLFLVQRINDGTANLAINLARYNINRSQEAAGPHVNTQDLLRLVQLLNGTNATQAFNGATVAACP